MESTVYKNHSADVNVIETFGYDPKDGFVRLELHLDRCSRTCEMLGRAFDRAFARQTLGEAVADRSARIRMVVDATGQIDVTVTKMAKPLAQFRVGVADQRLKSNDPWLQVKTSNRALYDKERANLPDGLDEMIYLNERSEVCEGTITNVFIRQNSLSNGRWITPPTKSGLLPGVLRQHMLETDMCTEDVLSLQDIRDADEFMLGNSLRGLIPAILVP